MIQIQYTHFITKHVDL